MILKNELQKRTDYFNDYWQKYLEIDVPENLYKAARHLPLAGGKRLRPFLVSISCESVSGDGLKSIPFGAALEIMHNFTLVHDDIMDKSKLRRNLPAVHIKYGEPTAILAGDFLFAKSFEAMHDLDVDLKTFKELEMGLIDCIIDICRGQQLDIEFENKKEISEEQYLDMIEKKTGVLFRLAARGGTIIGKGSEREINALTNYGMYLGLAFQIWDDYLDMSSDEETLGKDIGNDIRNGKKTLIAVHSIQNAGGENKKILDNIFGNLKASESDVRKVYSTFDQIGSIEYAKNTAINYNKKAKQKISILKESQAKQLLIDLVDYSIQREK